MNKLAHAFKDSRSTQQSRRSTEIQWTAQTWNPTVGCTRVSAGCDNCYAVKMTKRQEGMRPGGKYAGLVNPGRPHFNGVVRLHEPSLEVPQSWRAPTVIFVNSMSDLFHEGLQLADIIKVLDVCDSADQHVYQVLTKRPERLRTLLPSVNLPSTGRNLGTSPMPNVLFGTSTEDQASFDLRVPDLCQAPAAVRFLSMEPLLGPVDIKPLLSGPFKDQIHWIIIGGESGPGWRRMDLDWSRQIRDDAAALGIPFFFKQPSGLRPKTLGRTLDGIVHNGMPSLQAPWDQIINDFSKTV